MTGTITGTSSGITVNPAAASQLVITTGPAGATAGSAFATQPVVELRDAYGNLATGDTSTITATINTKAGAINP